MKEPSVCYRQSQPASQSVMVSKFVYALLSIIEPKSEIDQREATINSWPDFGLELQQLMCHSSKYTTAKYYSHKTPQLQLAKNSERNKKLRDQLFTFFF